MDIRVVRDSQQKGDALNDTQKVAAVAAADVIAAYGPSEIEPLRSVHPHTQVVWSGGLL